VSDGEDLLLAGFILIAISNAVLIILHVALVALDKREQRQEKAKALSTSRLLSKQPLPSVLQTGTASLDQGASSTMLRPSVDNGVDTMESKGKRMSEDDGPGTLRRDVTLRAPPTQNIDDDDESSAQDEAVAALRPAPTKRLPSQQALPDTTVWHRVDSVTSHRPHTGSTVRRLSLVGKRQTSVDDASDSTNTTPAVRIPPPPRRPESMAATTSASVSASGQSSRRASQVSGVMVIPARRRGSQV
jgi:hypothetical protein